MILFNIKLAIRNLAKNKIYSMLIIGGFAIGFATFILIGLFYHSEMTVNEDFVQYKQIYRLYDKSKQSFQLDYDLYPVLARSYPEIKYACPAGYLTGFEFSIKDEQLHTDTRVGSILSTNNNFFSVFAPGVITSLSSTQFSGEKSAVITSSVATRMYGDKNPVGKTININNFLNATITAVINDLPANSTFRPEILLNSDNEEFRLFQSCNNGVCRYLTNHFLLLDNNTDPIKFAEKIDQTIGIYGLDLEEPALQNLADIYLSPLTLEDMHSKGNNRLLIIFYIIAILILLLSTINYLNYIISIKYSKLKETGVNKVLGAGWRQFISYSATEVTIGIFLSILLSIGIVLILLPYSEILFGRSLQFFSRDTVKIIPSFLGIIMTIILISSSAPVLFLSQFSITRFLSGSGKRIGKQTTKQVMLTFQLAVSTALIAVVMVIFRQLYYVRNYNLGFDKEMMVRIDLPLNNPGQAGLKQEIDKLPFIIGSTFSFGCPGMINNVMGSNSGENSFPLDCIFIGDNYLKTMGIGLADGRTPMESEHGKACLINEEAYIQYGWENLEGKRFNNGKEGGYAVVGVTKNFHVKSLHQKVAPTVLIFDTQKELFNVLSVRLAPGKTSLQMDQIRKVWKEIIPDETMNFTFYDEQFQAMYEKEARLAKSISFFSIIAIILTCMGILSQIYLVSTSRLKEIGIRKINGAKVSEILVLLNKDFVKWLVIAFIIATPIAYYVIYRWLENFAYKTNLSWWIFALAGVLALGIALLTISWQSWKAATRNPVEALRYE